jgi:hypothetical protein
MLVNREGRNLASLTFRRMFNEIDFAPDTSNLQWMNCTSAMCHPIGSVACGMIMLASEESSRISDLLDALPSMAYLIVRPGLMQKA